MSRRSCASWACTTASRPCFQPAISISASTCGARIPAKDRLQCAAQTAETTVKAHVSAILRKLGVHNRIQAVLSAGNIDFSQYLRR
ncbi:LuxR C-terminal-related transcriptional regulator [Marinobacterium aestuariivivens]|uniref:LuxR C-terminal-related transcriptional regulator n=1 Tax=Marinobacterium aestuariivivens TaxID=1698799 RepID=A0ABW2A9L3_9GAMM